MSFLLDTNIGSAFLRRPSRLSHRFIQHAGRLSIAAVALGEIYTWAYRRSDPAQSVAAIHTWLLQEVTVIDFDPACARRFGELRAKMLTAGTPVHEVDLMIAAVALEHDLTLVTNNVKHFQPVPGLRVEDWLD